MVPIYAVAGGTFIVAGVIVAIIIAIAFSFYTYKGSTINAHPNDGLDGAPGAEDPSQPSGRGRTPEAHPDEFGTGGGFSTHGNQVAPDPTTLLPDPSPSMRLAARTPSRKTEVSAGAPSPRETSTCSCKRAC